MKIHALGHKIDLHPKNLLPAPSVNCVRTLCSGGSFQLTSLHKINQSAMHWNNVIPTLSKQWRIAIHDDTSSPDVRCLTVPALARRRYRVAEDAKLSREGAFHRGEWHHASTGYMAPTSATARSNVDNIPPFSETRHNKMQGLREKEEQVGDKAEGPNARFTKECLDTKDLALK